MTITTIEEARSLVGLTFERDGKRRTVTRVLPHLGYWNVSWRRPDGSREHECWCSTFSEWLRGATEVTE